MVDEERAVKNAGQKAFPFLFPAVVLYEELVFQLFSAGDFFSFRILLLLLFSLAYGSLGTLLLSLPKGEAGRRRLTAALLLLTSLPFIVEYFVYKQFKQFYDLNTMFSGAGDALTNGDWIYAFLVVAGAGTQLAFRAGQSVAGEALRTWGDSLLECIINWRKPAHTVGLVAYREA